MINPINDSNDGNHADLHSLHLESFLSAVQDFADLNWNKVLGTLATLFPRRWSVLSLSFASVEPAALIHIQTWKIF